MSGQTDSVSIVIPSYNAAGWLPAAIESCLRQTHPPCEVHVVDDGSTDGTLEILEPFSGKITVHPVVNGGVSSARNFGAAKTRGEWLIFLDADDVLLPNAVSDLLKTAVGSGAEVAYGMVIERREPPALPRLNGFDFCAGQPPVPAQANLHRCAIITPGSAVIHRSAFERAGGFVAGTEPLEDRDLWLRCGLLGPVAHCDAVVLDKTWRPASHGSQHAKRIYRGWLAKRRLRAWGEEHALEVGWLAPDHDLLTAAIREAFHWRCFEILPRLLEDAAVIGLRNGWTLRARVLLGILRSAGRAQVSPGWIERSAGLLT